MGLFDRMGRVVSSNFNALLDQLDNPRKSIELIVTEMREQLRAAQRHAVESVAVEKQLRQRVEELDAEIQRWEKRAELAVRSDDDALAREALAQKRRLVAERDKAESLRSEQRINALELKSELERMDRTIKGVEARKGTIAVQVEQARGGGGAEGLGHSGGGPTPFDELRRLESQVEGVEVAIEAQREVDAALGAGPGGMSLDEVEARFRALESGASPATAGDVSQVEQDLRDLKKRVRVE